MREYKMDVLEKFWPEQQRIFRDALYGGDIWSCDTGMSVVGYNDNPAATALFTRLTNEINETLDGSGFPVLNQYYIFQCEGDYLVCVIIHSEELQQGLLLNPRKLNMGILFNVAIPKALARVRAAM